MGEEKSIKQIILKQLELLIKNKLTATLSYIKTNFGWIIDLSIKSSKKQNRRQYHHNLQGCKGFLDRTHTKKKNKKKKS